MIADKNTYAVDKSVKNIYKNIHNFRCHAGEVTCLTGSKISSLVLSGGIDGKTCIYDMNRKLMVNHVKYSSSVSAIKWLPLEVRVLCSQTGGNSTILDIEGHSTG